MDGDLRKRIQEIVNENQEPDQDKCPNVIIYWKKGEENGRNIYVEKDIIKDKVLTESESIRASNNGYSYYNYYFRPDWDKIREANTIVRSPARTIQSFYFKDHKSGILEISLIEIPGNRTGGPKKWSFYKRYFIFNFSKEVYVCYPQTVSKEIKLHYDSQAGKYYDKDFCQYVFPEIIKTYNNHAANKILYEYIKNTGTMAAAQIGLDDDRVYYYPWNFIRFYKQNLKEIVVGPPSKKLSKEAAEAATIMQCLGDFKEELKGYIPKRITVSSKRGFYNGRTTITNTRLLKVEAIDGWGIIRVISRTHMYTDNSGKIHCNEPKEIARLLVSPKGKIYTYAVNYKDNTAKRTAKSIDNFLPYDWKQEVVVIGKENIEKCLHLKYLKDILNKQANTEFVPTIMAALRHPIIEQLLKMNCGTIVTGLMYNGTIAADFQEVFGIKDTKAPIAKQVNITPIQLKKINDLFDEFEPNTANAFYPRNARNYISNIKEILGVEKISDLSKEDTDFYFRKIYAFSDGFGRNWKELFFDNHDYHGNYYYTWYNYRRQSENDEPITEEQRIKVKKLIRICGEDKALYRIFYDAITMFNSLRPEDRPNFDFFDFEDIHEVQVVHDNLVALREEIRRRREIERAKGQESGMKKNYKKAMEKFAYENDEFFIKAPKTPKELIEEGCRLAHCVGSYVNRVAEGSTNILFLRKKEAPDESFYTIEVNNNNVVVQIHGKNNRWLGNNPEAIPFVVAWLLDKNIAFNREQILSVSTGYMSRGEMIDGKQFGL